MLYGISHNTIAERILSSEGRMSSAQKAYVASAVRLARMMSPDQLSALCCARGSGDKLVTRKKDKESNKLVAARETSWSHSGR